jgi:endonuclease I
MLINIRYRDEKPMRRITIKTRLFLVAAALLSISMLPAVALINENIQNWDAHTSYGSYSQLIPAGNVAMTRCIVAPGAAATGTCSTGRIQLEAATGIVELPELQTIGQVEVHMAAGSSGRSIQLQRLNGVAWEEIITFSGIATTGTTFSFDLNSTVPATLRLAIPSHAIYVHDIIVTDYQATELPIVTTMAVSNMTYDSAVSGGIVENSGSSAVTARGVCWSLNAEPTINDSYTIDGSGIGSFTSTLTGLTPETYYHVRAYATNTSGTVYGQDIPFMTTNIGIPSLQASNLVLYPGTTSIQASWTPGNGAMRIVKVNTSNNFTLPVNGITYAANPMYTGNGEQVVYNGATEIIDGESVNAVSVTNLIPNTNYWFRVFDYNGTGTETQYNVTLAANNPRSATTQNSSLTGYYEGVSGTGQTLKTNLHNLLRMTHLTNFSYDALWTQLQYTDEDSTNTNNILELYTGWSVPQSYSGGGVDQWNREHTWSKSHGDFGEVPPAGTDLHHLRPADVTVNSAKGNKDFDNGGTAYTDSSPYTGYSGTTGCYTDTDSWEPRAVEKGDVARMILYMAIRYEGTDTSYDLEMQDVTPTTGPYYGKLSTLLQWLVQDPPDSWEMRRNNRIQERQGNRNPFIDHPEFARMIWAPTTTYATVTDTVSFVANWSHAINAQSYVLDVATDSLFTSYVTGYQNLNVGYTNNSNVTGLSSDTIYYYRLRAFFVSGYSMNSNVTAVQLTGTSIDDFTHVSDMTTIIRIYPNPFHTSVSVDFTLGKTGTLSLQVYNLKGQCVRTLFSGTKAKGKHTMSWDGKRPDGKLCAPGIYLIRLVGGTKLLQQKLLLY